ncbi:MAG: pilus assembly protein TadG-related protein [Acidimicrobiia bacterium]
MTTAGGSRGSVTLWMLGCCLLVLTLGGLSLDLWRAFSERRAVAAAADAAALAGASAVDEARYRSSAEVVLVPSVAEARAQSSLRTQLDTVSVRSAHVTVSRDAATVTVRAYVGFSLLRLVGDGGFDIAVTSTATPARSS